MVGEVIDRKKWNLLSPVKVDVLDIENGLHGVFRDVMSLVVKWTLRSHIYS